MGLPYISTFAKTTEWSLANALFLEGIVL